MINQHAGSVDRRFEDGHLLDYLIPEQARPFGKLLCPARVLWCTGDMELDPDIAAHYAQRVERARLSTSSRLEGERTWELLQRFLPAAPAVVLDVGGAEGAYALPLARAGYTVHLLDPVPEHVHAARAASREQASAPLASVEVGDARALPAENSTVNALLLLGPLYHLPEDDQREQALDEARRVLRAGGVLLAAGISRFASTFDGVRTGAITEPTFEAMVQADLNTGVHRNPDVAGRPEWLTLAYFPTPDELRRDIQQAGFLGTDVLAVEGPGARADLHASLDEPGTRAAVLRAVARVEREPSLLGASPRLRAVATRP